MRTANGPGADHTSEEVRRMQLKERAARFFFIAIFGAIILFYGYSEYHLASKSAATPQAMAVAELEKGIPANNYLTLGDHVPLYKMVIYSHSKGSQTVDYAYYPITTKDDLQKIVHELGAKHGGDTRAITDTEFGKAFHPAVLVKTHDFSTIDKLKEAVDKEKFPTSNVTGMVVNEIDNLGNNEREMLEGAYPGSDLKNVIIFEAGRKPTPPATSLAIMGAGGAVILLGVMYLFKKR